MIVKKKRSVEIPPDKLKEIRKAIKSFETWTEAQEEIKVGRNALERITLKNTCSPDTLVAIINYLNK